MLPSRHNDTMTVVPVGCSHTTLGVCVAADGAGHPVSLVAAMSMPGEREAQNMLRGVSPLSRTQSVLGGGGGAQQLPKNGGDAASALGGAGIGACAEQRGAAALEKKPEPGVGARPLGNLFLSHLLCLTVVAQKPLFAALIIPGHDVDMPGAL